MAAELARLQERFWSWITAPTGARSALAADGSSAESVAEQWLEPPAQGTALERLEIYANMYFYRLLDSLRSDCPRLLALLGDRHFHNLVTDYLLAHPSRHPSLRQLPRQLAAFLRRHPLSERWPAAGDLAALEWARASAFDAADAAVLSRERLASLPPERWAALTLAFVPSLRVLEAEHAVHELWSALDGAGAPPPAPPRAPTALLVWRQELVVYHRPLSALEALALAAARAGASFGEVCARVREVTGDAQAAPAAAALIARWVADGLLSTATGASAEPSASAE